MMIFKVITDKQLRPPQKRLHTDCGHWPIGARKGGQAGAFAPLAFQKYVLN